MIKNLIIARIKIPVGRRETSDVDTLASSIKSQGLINPITVDASHRLVAGAHRLAACRSLGWKSIPARVIKTTSKDDLKLIEIDENLCRRELTVLERAQCLTERKLIYERLYPDVSGPGRPRKNAEIISGFSTDTGKRTGFSDRTIRQELQIARDIPEDVQKMLKGTKLANQKVELLQLAQQPKVEQRKLAKIIA